MAVFNTGTSAADALGDDSTRATLQDLAVPQLFSILTSCWHIVNYGRGAGVGTVWRTIDRTGAFWHGERFFGD